MTSPTQDRTEGKIDEAKGKVKSAVGDLTGNNKTKTEGSLDQATGKLKQGVADAKDKLNDAIHSSKSN